MNQTGHDESLIGGHTLDQLFFVAFSQVSIGLHTSVATAICCLLVASYMLVCTIFLRNFIISIHFV